MSEFATIDLVPTEPVKAESPLAMCRVDVITEPKAQSAGVVVREHAFLGHLVLRGNAGDAGFVNGVEQALGVPLPLKMGPLSVDEARGVSLQWISPDEWLIIVPGGEAFAAEQRLRETLGGHFAVMNVSGGQTVLELSGPAVPEMLMKCTPYDVHPNHFPVGKGVSTTFAKTTAIIRRLDEDRWALVIRRSFADYLYRWLLDASEEFGVHVAR
ncbi:sarcosine oxidase subunit gamma [Denitromonas iodatirespirans]|uniref:Sarcosine oxidase subunit gamma family protein n=1 Tax=Denitromonas iodatirespirans TaxID=2795389 RepID=A0A944D8I2_DENI1|nr:sarcosine oxidase subunit gamma family protein [Denitromonas iodatirespirans]MBT0961919.1 sarcosine oxidase subunit gamma family protein [Denitromonas iodatirespirans]